MTDLTVPAMVGEPMAAPSLPAVSAEAPPPSNTPSDDAPAAAASDSPIEEVVLPPSKLDEPVPAVHVLSGHAPALPDAPSDERLVSYVIQQYRAAYENLDVTAAQSIWPTVDARALGAAFRQLAGQRVTFDSCGVDISGLGQATARCRGQAEYVPKVGARRAYVASGEWTFALAKQDAAWRIVNASASIK